MFKNNAKRDKFNFAMEKLVFGNSGSWIITGLAAFLICIYFPRSLHFLGAIVPDKYYVYFPIGLLTTVFHIYVLAIMFVNVITLVCMNLTFTLYLTFLLTNELRFGQTQYITSEKLRKPVKLRHAYRSFQVLMANMLCFHGQHLYIIYLFCTILPVFCICILIRYGNYLQMLSWALIMCMVALSVGVYILLLQLGKYLFIRGNKVLRSWQNKNWNSTLETKIMNRFKRSCRLVLIRHGNLLVLGRMTQFLYVKNMMRMIFKVLVMMMRN